MFLKIRIVRVNSHKLTLINKVWWKGKCVRMEGKLATVFIASSQEYETLELHYLSWAVVAHIFNLSTQKAEKGADLWVRDQPGIHSEFQGSQKYREILPNKNKSKKRLHYLTRLSCFCPVLRLCELICSVKMKYETCKQCSMVQCSANMWKALGLLIVTGGKNVLLE